MFFKYISRKLSMKRHLQIQYRMILAVILTYISVLASCSCYNFIVMFEQIFFYKETSHASVYCLAQTSVTSCKCIGISDLSYSLSVALQSSGRKTMVTKQGVSKGEFDPFVIP